MRLGAWLGRWALGPAQAGAGAGSMGEPPAPLDLQSGHTGDSRLAGRGLTDESEILRFLQHGTLVGLLPVPHPILIRKYQANSGTAMWFRTYMWGVIYLRWAPRGFWGSAVPPESRLQLVGLMSRLSTGVVLSGGGGHPLPGAVGGGQPSSSPVCSSRLPGPQVTVDPLRRNVDPPVWYDTDVKLFEIQRV